MGAFPGLIGIPIGSRLDNSTALRRPQMAAGCDGTHDNLRRALKKVLLARRGDRVAARVVWMDMIGDAIQSRSERAAMDFEELPPTERQRAAGLLGSSFGIPFDAFCILRTREGSV